MMHRNRWPLLLLLLGSVGISGFGLHLCPTPSLILPLCEMLLANPRSGGEGSVSSVFLTSPSSRCGHKGRARLPLSAGGEGEVRRLGGRRTGGEVPRRPPHTASIPLLRVTFCVSGENPLAILPMPYAPAVLAQGEEPPPHREITDDEVNAIAEQLYCPVCENVPLDVCGTRACADWREEIRAMLQEGHTEEEIKAYFAERYGRRVLVTPDASGVDLLVWVLPPVGVAVGGVVLALALRRMAPDALATSADPASALRYDDLDSEYVARLEGELKEFSG